MTAALASGTGPAPGNDDGHARGGVATFTDLADDKAETITLVFTSGGLTTATSSNIVVSPAAASQLVIHTQPSRQRRPGRPSPPSR